MDSLGYTFFIPGINVYIYTPLLSPLSSFPNPSLRSIGNSTAYPFFRKKEKKGGERDTLQFKVANSPFANLLLLL